MKPMTAEWVAKAEGDFATMEREGRVTENPNYEAVCCHAQQCAERYLKARLYEADVPFGKIHDLSALLDQAIAVEADWEGFREDLAYISDLAVASNYPGGSADAESAARAQHCCRRFRDAARDALRVQQQTR
ncbi:MAG: HEPN domain-containing protein [Phycisphaerales bacterium]|nr:MAG: HEPN domain-containing protein [Phycisphaerales bacterium]